MVKQKVRSIRFHTSPFTIDNFQMLDFRLNVKGSNEFCLGIQSLAGQIADWRGAWPGIAGHLITMLTEQFGGEGARATGTPWAPLSKQYAKRKQEQYPGRPILQASGRLWQSLVGRTQDTVEEQEPLKLKFGSRLDYAVYLQSGTGKGLTRTSSVPTGPGTGRGMPQRVIFDLAGPDNGAAITKQAQGHAANIAQGVGFGLSRAGGSSNPDLLADAVQHFEPGGTIIGASTRLSERL